MLFRKDIHHLFESIGLKQNLCFMVSLADFLERTPHRKESIKADVFHMTVRIYTLAAIGASKGIASNAECESFILFKVSGNINLALMPPLYIHSKGRIV